MQNITRESYEMLHRSGFWQPFVRGILEKEQVEYSSLERFSHGANLVCHADRRIVVKCFPPFHQHDFMTETAVLKALAKAALPVQTPEWLRSGVQEGWPYFLMSYIEGELLIGLWEKLEPKERKRTAEELGRLIRSVHREVTPEKTGLPDHWMDFLCQQTARAIDHHVSAGLPDRFLQDVPFYIKEAALENITSRALLTGEYTPFNLLMTRTEDGMKLTGLIDFADCLIGDPYYDLLGPILFNFCREEGLTAAFLEAYGLELTPNLRRHLMALLLLHRFSDLPAYIKGHHAAEEAKDLHALSAAFFPW